MQIATWNVNSVRTRLQQIKDWLEEVEPDILCIQETKVQDSLFPKDKLEESGFNVCFHGQKSYNGVALISRHPLTDVRYGMDGELPNDLKAFELI